MATFVAATVPVEKEGQTSPLLEEALKVGALPDKPTQDTAAEPEPNVGSYEAFMTQFGRAMR